MVTKLVELIGMIKEKVQIKHNKGVDDMRIETTVCAWDNCKQKGYRRSRQHASLCAKHRTIYAAMIHTFKSMLVRYDKSVKTNAWRPFFEWLKERQQKVDRSTISTIRSEYHIILLDWLMYLFPDDGKGVITLNQMIVLDILTSPGDYHIIRTAHWLSILSLIWKGETEPCADWVDIYYDNNRKTVWLSDAIPAATVNGPLKGSQKYIHQNTDQNSENSNDWAINYAIHYGMCTFIDKDNHNTLTESASAFLSYHYQQLYAPVMSSFIAKFKVMDTVLETICEPAMCDGSLPYDLINTTIKLLVSPDLASLYSSPEFKNMIDQSKLNPIAAKQIYHACRRMIESRYKEQMQSPLYSLLIFRFLCLAHWITTSVLCDTLKNQSSEGPKNMIEIPKTHISLLLYALKIYMKAYDYFSIYSMETPNPSNMFQSSGFFNDYPLMQQQSYTG